MFKIIWDGPEKNKLIKLSKNLKINNQIKFLGFKKPSEIKSAMKKFDIYLNCSHFEFIDRIHDKILLSKIDLFLYIYYLWVNQIQ